MSNGKINSIKTTDNVLNPYLDYYNIAKVRVKFNKGCLKQDHPTIVFRNGIIDFYTVYEITDNSNVSTYPTFKNCLFGIVKLTKNADLDKYGYSSYGIGFDRKGFFSHPSGGTGRNVIIFGVDMNSSTKIDNRKKDILILGKGPTQGLECTLSVEKMYSINFTEKTKKFCLSLHYNGADSYLSVNGTEITKFKVPPNSICLGNVSKDWSVDNMKKTGLKGYLYDFSVDYNATAVSDILDIHKYLMEKNKIVVV